MHSLSICAHISTHAHVHTHTSTFFFFNGSFGLAACFQLKTISGDLPQPVSSRLLSQHGGRCVLSAGSGYSDSRELPLWLEAGLNQDYVS